MISTPHILAIDLGKFHSVLCHFDVATRCHSFRTIPTTPDEMRDAIQCQPGVTVVVEACSPAGWVTDLCHSLNVPIIVTATHGPAWSWKHI